MNSRHTFIDLFAGSFALSEGFVRNGFLPVGHVEVNSDACYTIKTRIAYHYLKNVNMLKQYAGYLKGDLSREQLYSLVPEYLFQTVLNEEISNNNLKKIFGLIDHSLQMHNKKAVDVIVGGPPCQAYSLIGRHRQNIEDDPRNMLYILYGRFLNYYSPKIFIFENVPGILSASDSYYFNNLRKYFRKLGYNVHWQTMNASDYGVLQNRKRIIITGIRKDLNYTEPKFEIIENNWTTKYIFSDLGELKSGEGNMIGKYSGRTNLYLSSTGIRDGIRTITHHITRPHNVNDLAIYKIAIEKFHEGKRLKYNDLPRKMRTHKNTTSFLDRFKVVSDKGFSHTVVAHISKDGHYYIHPDIKQCRSISVREAARIQSFPDDFYFEGSRTSAFSQIGNAVPPLLANAIAKTIMKII